MTYYQTLTANGEKEKEKKMGAENRFVNYITAVGQPHSSWIVSFLLIVDLIYELYVEN